MHGAKRAPRITKITYRSKRHLPILTNNDGFILMAAFFCHACAVTSVLQFLATQRFCTQTYLKTRTIWNRMRPRALMQNQHTRELLSAWVAYSNSPGMRVSARHINSTRGTSWINPCVCTSGGVYVPSTYSDARWVLLSATRVFVVVLFWVIINSPVCWFF